jgi:hypothetical protein
VKYPDYIWYLESCDSQSLLDFCKADQVGDSSSYCGVVTVSHLELAGEIEILIAELSGAC